MATQGWDHVSVEQAQTMGASVAPPRRRRRTVDEQLRDLADERLESELQAEVIAELERQRLGGAILCFTHVHNPRRDRPGLPDLIIGIRDDLLVGIELKRPDGRGQLRPEQRTWLRAFGARGCVRTSLAGVIDALRRWRQGLPVECIEGEAA